MELLNEDKTEEGETETSDAIVKPEMKEDTDSKKFKKENDTEINAEEKEKKADEEEIPEVIKLMKKVIKMDPEKSTKWSGSFTFLKKYVKKALNRID